MAELISPPVWRLISPDSTLAMGTESGLPLHIGYQGGGIGALLQEAMGVRPGGWVLVTFDRGLARGLADLLAHGRLRRRPTVGRKRLIRLLRDSGFRVEAEYDVWPSAGAPRIVLPHSDPAGVRWICGSGVLGGGGRVLWKRALARSPLMTAFARLLPPAGALFARRVA